MITKLMLNARKGTLRHMQTEVAHIALTQLCRMNSSTSTFCTGPFQVEVMFWVSFY